MADASLPAHAESFETPMFATLGFLPEGEVFADLADEHMGELLQRLEDPARSTFTGAWCELYGPPDCPFDNPCD